MTQQDTQEPLKRLCLANLGGQNVDGVSGAEELFAELLSDMLKNIARLDTDATEPREITIKVKIIPNADRTVGAVEVSGSAKPAKLNSAHGRIYLGRVGNELVAAPVPETMPLFETPKADLKAVAAPAPAVNQ